MGKPNSNRRHYRRSYRRSGSLRSIRWRIRRAIMAVGVVMGLGMLAAGAIGGGGSSYDAAPTAVVLRGGDAWQGIRPPGNSDAPSAGGNLIDSVTRVRDGDTIVVGLIPIRIANLDCAESGSAAGDRATRRVKQLVSGKTVTCRLEGRRSYDREVGVCALPDGRDLGEVLIAEGMCGRW